jgi:ABC-2 type transport system permease protein
VSTLVVDTWWMTARRLKVGLSQPAYVVISLIQPVIWLFLFGNLFERVVNLGGFGTTSYLDYLVPGVVVMNALAVNMWAGMVTLEEIERGTLNRFLTPPVSRSAIINSNVVEQAVGTTFQSPHLHGPQLQDRRSERHRAGQ